MRYRPRQPIAATLALALFCAALTFAGSYAPLVSAHEDHGDSELTPDACSVVGWVPYWDQEKAVESFREHADTIDHLSLFWYHIDPAGAIRKYTHAEIDRSIIEYAHDNDVKVFALVANLPDDQRENGDHDWDPDRVGRLLSTEETRKAHISGLVELTHKLGVDGINIDYEALPVEYRSDFTAFIRELGKALHAEDKLLAVALHPKTSETNPAEDNGSHAQDWEELPKYADQLHLMTYGEHNSGTHPGPIASPDWVEAIVRYARDVRDMPADKLFLGVPLYAEAWEPSDSGGYRAAKVDLTFEDIERVKKKYVNGTSSTDEYETPSFVFENSNGKDRVVWFENKTSVGRKLAVGREFGVCNFAFWRLGGEDPTVWESVREAVDPTE